MDVPSEDQADEHSRLPHANASQQLSDFDGLERAPKDLHERPLVVGARSHRPLGVESQQHRNVDGRRSERRRNVTNRNNGSSRTVVLLCAVSISPNRARARSGLQLSRD